MINANYGKLVNNNVKYAPSSLETEIGTIFSPTQNDYLEFGWKKIIDVRPTPSEGKYVKATGWIESETEITRTYEEKDIPVQPKTYSKLQLETALLKRNLLTKFDDFLDTTFVPGSNVAIRRFYTTANDLRDDHPLIVEYKNQTKIALEVDDATLTEILSESEI